MSDTTVAAVASDDPDALYRAFAARAAALPAGAVGAADALAADIAGSAIPDSTFRPLAAAIAKATGLDSAALYKRMLKARGVYEDTETDQAAVDLPCASDPEPSATPRPVGVLLDAIVRVIQARVHCPLGAAHAVALWCVATWGVFPPSDPSSGPDIFPRLHLFSPTKRCGKSTFLEVVQYAVRRPLPATDVSDAAVYRTIPKYHPTFLVDEADQLFRKRPEFVGMANSGYSRAGQVIRTIEVQVRGVRTFEPVPFPTFAAMALAGIGSLPATVEDRSLQIPLQRQPQGQQRKRITLRHLAQMRATLGPHLMAHADAIGATTATGVPDSTIPRGLSDRAADNWRPLLAVADMAGGAWPHQARRAATEICAVSADGDRGDDWAVRQIVEGVAAFRRAAIEGYRQWVQAGRKAGRPLPGRPAPQRTSPCRFVPSEGLAAWLMAKDDSGFGDLRDIGTVKLRVARLLRRYEVQPTVRKIGGEAARGYDVAAIRGVWRRYQP